ncbi:F-box protein SKIP24, partial [Linum perenne]
PTTVTSKPESFHGGWQASVVLNVWQPQAVRGRQKQVVEQCSVPIESQLHSLEMEMKLCKQQIFGLKKTHKDEKLRLEAAEKELESMKYHPLHEVNRSAGVAKGPEWQSRVSCEEPYRKFSVPRSANE